MVGYLLWLVLEGGGSPWASTVEDSSFHRLECASCVYSDGVCRDWLPSDHFVDDLAASRVSDDPDVWTDGSDVVEELSGIGAGGSGVYAHRSGSGWFGRKWRHVDLLPPDSDLGMLRCAVLESIPEPLQSVQRAEFWRVYTCSSEFLCYSPGS